MIGINGRFLSQATTGVQRYARELVLALDKISSKVGDNTFLLFVPKNANLNNFVLKNIKIKTIGGNGNYYWEQVTLPKFCLKMKINCLLNLCNLAPLALKSKNVITVHDTAFRDHPEFYSKKIAFFYNLLIPLVAKKSRFVFTVSSFSKTRLVANYGLSPKKVIVAYNGVDFSSFQTTKLSVSKRLLEVSSSPFFFSVGSKSPNKNMKYIVECAKKHPIDTFVVSGSSNKVFNVDGNTASLPSNIIDTGYISDAELGYLYSKCKAFIFPSHYEGFGLPPLEALACGCRNLIVSNIPAMHEIFNKADVSYIDPDDYNCNNFPIKPKAISENDAMNTLQRFTWEKTAKIVMHKLMTN